MGTFFDVRDVTTAWKLAVIVQALNPLNGFADLSAALQLLGVNGNPRRLFAARPGIPSFLWVDTGEQVLVFASGILTAFDGLAVFASTLQPLTRVGSWTANDACVGAAGIIYTALGDRFVPGPRSWCLVGHSYGGSSLCALAGLLDSARVIADLQLLSFGSPRPGDSTLSDELTKFSVRRIMNSDDPVPRFPPHLDEAPLLSVAAGYAVAARWAGYTQPAGGLVAWPDGTLRTAQLPPQFIPITDVTLLGWALSDRGFFATGHQIGKYTQRLQAAAFAAAQVAGTLSVGSSPEPTAALSPARFQAAQSGTLTPSLSLPEVVMPQGFIPATYRAKAVKVMPNVYMVQWMGMNVMTGTNRSNARALARGLNAFLRRMQGASSADHTAFNAALAAYWLVCVSSSLGFNPPLVVT